MSRKIITKKNGVLLVGNFLSKKGGGFSYCEGLAEKLEARKWTVISTSNQRNPVFRLFDMLLTATIKKDFYEVANVDVFSGKGFFWAEAISKTLRFLKKPYCITLRGGKLPEWSSAHPNRIVTLLSNANVVTTPSNYIKHSFSHIRPDIIYIPNASDLNKYQFRIRDQNLSKLCWLRSLHSIYEPELAILVLSILVSNHSDLSLTMIGPDKGDGSYQRALSLAKELNVSDKVHFVGWVPKETVPQWLSQSDIFLNTTRFESFGVSVMEAAATGLCIVTTNVGELPYIWENKKDALLVPPSDPQSMAAAVEDLLAQPDLAKRLSINARKKAELFCWENILPQWENILLSLIQRNSE